MDLSLEMTALAALHDRLWDDAAGLCRLAPGAVGLQEAAPIELHPIRETALGAWVDLERGDIDRGVRALRGVLRHQYDAPGRPWDGTFKVTAQDPEPPWPGARAWRDYDSNWRQFLGCILALVDLHYGEMLPDDLRADIAAAVERCARSEPDDRIPDWYTNPNLLQAWLAGHVGQRVGDERLSAAGRRRREMVMARLARHRDVDEYNSPTYDGIDLLAALLWIVHPPTPDDRTDGLHLASVLIDRIEDLYHPSLAVICGPYVRAYGVMLADHVSLLGLVLRVLGVDAPVLPAVLDLTTDHVHDLYFLPVLAALAARAPEVQFMPRHGARRRVQRFGEVVATSVRAAEMCVGWEDDRRAEFARDQYVPVCVHIGHGSDVVEYLAVMLGGTAVRVRSEPVGDPDAPTGLIVTVTASDAVTDPGAASDGLDLRLLSRGALEMALTDEGVATVHGVPGVALICTPAPTAMASVARGVGIVTTLEVDAAVVTLQISWVR